MLPQNKLRLPLQIINRLGDLKNRIDNASPRLDVEDLQQHAVAATDLSDFGDPYYRDGLSALIASAKNDELNFLGRRAALTVTREYAKTRLEWVEMQKREPAAFATELLAPFIVTGLPRSGTTVLHRMLAADPSAQAIPLWQLMKPFPPLDGGEDERYDAMARKQRVLDRVRPDLASKHEISPDSPEECVIVQGMSFNSISYFATMPVYGYLDWYLQADRTKMYAEYASVLRWYQSLDARRLVMKSPPHMADLPALMAAVPNAMVVQTHRDPVKVANSLNSLFHTMHSSLMRPYVPQKMVDTNLRMLEWLIERNLAFRANSQHNICDIFFKDLVSDPAGTVRKIYDHFGLTWTDSAENTLTQFMAANPRNKHGKHQYGSADFGLNDDAIRERFAGYSTAFDL